MELVRLGTVRDARGRGLRELRVSVTDRCNFRCPYCMPAERFGPGHRFLPGDALLSFAELERIVRVAAGLGVRKVRLTGGEPLLRPRLEELIARLAAVDGVEELALTTNGSLLSRRARALADAGLTRVTVSLDALDEAAFRAMSGGAGSVAEVLAGIEAALEAGLRPVKINAVVRRGVNDGEVLALARRFRGSGCVLRFIEYMDVGSCNGWRREEVVPASELVERIAAELPLVPLEPAGPGATARRFAYADGGGELGVVASVTQPFCAGCTRARLTADGQLYTCLFATRGHDLRAALRAGEGHAALRARLAGIWAARDDAYSERRDALAPLPGKVEMSRVGG